MSRLAKREAPAPEEETQPPEVAEPKPDAIIHIRLFGNRWFADIVDGFEHLSAGKLSQVEGPCQKVFHEEKMRRRRALVVGQEIV